MNTNALAVSFLRAQGWLAEIVQQQRGPVRYDLFGIGDVLAFHPVCDEVRLLNACAGRDVKEHMHRYRGSYPLSAWINGGDRVFCLFVWRRVKPRGKRPYLLLTVSRAVIGGKWEDEGVYKCRMDGRPMA